MKDFGIIKNLIGNDVTENDPDHTHEYLYFPATKFL